MHKLIFCLSFNVMLCIANAQNIGINTTLPASTLDVNGSLGLKVTTITSSTTLSSTDAIMLCNNSSFITVTLPTAIGISGRIYTLKNINTGSVNIVGTSGQTIDGLPSGSLLSQYDFTQLVSNGNNWNILDEEAPRFLAYTFASGQTLGSGDFIGIGTNNSNFDRNCIVSPFDCELRSITFSTRVLTDQFNVNATVWVNGVATSLSTTIANGITTLWSSAEGSHFVNKGDLISIKVNTTSGLVNGVSATLTYH